MRPGNRIQKLRSLGALLFLVLLTGTAGDAKACSLALVLALDVSQSVNSAEYALQNRGVANAFRDKGVRAALLAYEEPVASIAFQWSGAEHQTAITDWTLFSGPGQIDHFANQIEKHGRTMLGQKTAIGSALEFHDECGSECVQVGAEMLAAVQAWALIYEEATDGNSVAVEGIIFRGEQTHGPFAETDGGIEGLRTLKGDRVCLDPFDSD